LSYCESFFLLVERLAENTLFLLDTSQDGSNPLGPPAWCQVPPSSAMEYHQSTLRTSLFLQVYSPCCPQSLTLHHLLPFLLVAPKIAHETTKMLSCSILQMVCSPFGDSWSNSIQRNRVCLLLLSRHPFLPLRAFLPWDG